MAGHYVVFGTVPWQAPWLTEQNLAHALAERSRVLYVEPPITALTPLRHGLRRQSLGDARALVRRGLRREGGVQVFRPVALPPLEHPRARRLSLPLLRAQVRRAARLAGLERPVAIAARSTLGLEGAAGERASVYLMKDWVEAGAALIGRPGAELAGEWREMCRRADLVCAISTQLQERLAAEGVESQLLRHGFQAGTAALYDGAAPAEYAGLPRPLLGFAGGIDGRLDLELLETVARRFEPGTLVLIGPVSPRLDRTALDRLASLPNVRLLGPRTREELPPYLAHLDCSLIPYRADEWGRHGSPLKLWDYLYAGPPVVGSGYRSLAAYPPPLVRFAEGADEFCAAVAEALAQPGQGRDERRATALANTWAQRAGELEILISEYEKGRKFGLQTGVSWSGKGDPGHRPADRPGMTGLGEAKWTLLR